MDSQHNFFKKVLFSKSQYIKYRQTDAENKILKTTWL